MIKNCVICGKQFDATRGKKTCSKECSHELKKRSDLKAAQAANQRHQQLQQLKDTWLTIPDAPSYEINKQLQVRNKVTGHMLKLQKTKTRTIHYVLNRNTVTGKSICRSPKSLFRQALAAVTNDTFVPLLPPLDSYEVNERGVCRNIHTKKILRPTGRGKTYSLYANNKKFHRSRNSLIWEAHGTIKKSFRHVPVWAEHRTGKFFFPNLTACARFLKDKIYYSLHTLQHYLWGRKPNIGDWKFTYLDESPADIKWNMRGLTKLAHCHQKAEAASP